MGSHWHALTPERCLCARCCLKFADRPDGGAHQGDHQRHAPQPQSCGIDGHRHCQGHVQGIRAAEANNKPRGRSPCAHGQPNGAAQARVCTRIRPDSALAGEPGQQGLAGDSALQPSFVLCQQAMWGGGSAFGDTRTPAAALTQATSRAGPAWGALGPNLSCPPPRSQRTGWRRQRKQQLHGRTGVTD